MRRILLILLISLLLVGCDEGVYSGTLIFDGEHQFAAGAHLPGNVYMRAGTAEFAVGSRISGTVYVVGGTLRLNGEVGGDVPRWMALSRWALRLISVAICAWVGERCNRRKRP